MMKSILQSPLKLIGILAIAVAIGAWFAWDYRTPPPGYCRAKERYLSDDDFINIVLEETADAGRMKGVDGSEKSIQAFRSKHPNCCGVGRGGWPAMHISDDVVVVEIVYELSVRDMHATKSKYYNTVFTVGPCGETHKETGEGMDEKPKEF